MDKEKPGTEKKKTSKKKLNLYFKYGKSVRASSQKEADELLSKQI